jgi:hypothetical protein
MQQGAVDRERNPGGRRNRNGHFLAGKIRRILQYAHLRRCASNRTAQRISIYASRFGFLRALHMNAFEQPIKMGFFNKPNRVMSLDR